MDWRNVAKETEGLHTVGSFSRSMNIHRNTAITYIHALRKNGFVETKRGKKGKRLYDISPLKLKKIGSRGFFDVLNEHSSLKIRKPFEHRVYGKTLTLEETVIYALKTRDFRIILASIKLFQNINNWNLLYNLAKKNGLERHIGALYALSRKYFRVRRIDGRILRRMKQSPISQKYVIPKLRSSDFREIENEWRVFIPFNRGDLERLRR